MNRLASESSPYLLQHASNPVDWFPWGTEAFQAARELDLPLFVSIGYSTCHWCHVMERESFDDAAVAALMNRAFICVKVDREERPDVDSLYMRAVTAMTGRGGWPLNVILTHDGKPFYAATYLPRSGSLGRVGMLELIPAVARAWREERQELERIAESTTAALQPTQKPSGKDVAPLGAEDAEQAASQLAGGYDREFGGFGRSPKFPMAHNLLFLARRFRRTGDNRCLSMALDTLGAIRRGGVFDQLGYGVHRYSTDRKWHLPHFEKMLYDQAMLAMAALETWEVSGDAAMLEMAGEILDYVLTDLSDSKGGFFSAEDADSPEGEGYYYTWTASSLRSALSPEEYRLAKRCWGISEDGNYREEATGLPAGRNILFAADDPKAGSREGAMLEEIRERLLKLRSSRRRPPLDDKVLADWNGLIIAALARGGTRLRKPHYTDAARGAAEFVLEHMRSSDGGLLHRHRTGKSGIRGFADDYAGMSWGLLELHRSTQDHKFLLAAMELMDILDARFSRGSAGGYFLSPDSSGMLPARPRELADGAIPTANSMALQNLYRLWRITGAPRYRESLDRLLSLYGEEARSSPAAHCMAMAALEEMLSEPVDVIVCGPAKDPATSALLEEACAGANSVVLRRPEDDLLSRLAPHTSELRMVDGEPTAYVCRNFSCGMPITRREDLSSALG